MRAHNLLNLYFIAKQIVKTKKFCSLVGVEYART